MQNVIQGLQWRYASNKFDTQKKLSDSQIDGLLQAMILAPSSFGLQPWKFIVVTNPDIRAKLQEAGYGQPKIAEASHLIVLAAKTNIDEALADEYVASVSQTRGIPVENLKGLGDMIKGSYAHKSPSERIEWAARQVYIALGVLVAAGASEGIDVAPMEGFDPKKFDEILGLTALNLESKVIAAVGFRAADDEQAHAKKVRFPKEEVVITIA